MPTTSRRLRRPLFVLVTAGVTSLALTSVALTAAFGGFSAAVTNNSQAAGSGTLLLQEAQGSTVCISTGSGTTPSSSISSNANTTCPVSLFGSTNLEPGQTAVSATVTLSNPGTLAGSSLTLAPGTCTAGDNTTPGGISNTYFGTDTSGFCGKIDVTIENDTTSGSPACVYPSASSAACPAPSASGTLASLVSGGPISLPGIASHGTATYKVSVTLDSSATNADQGLLATLPITFTLNQ
jgi:hypothetical protein